MSYRATALRILISLGSDFTNVDEQQGKVESILKEDRNYPQHKDDILDIVDGVIKHKLTLDWLIEKISGSKTTELDIKLLSILRLTFYQLIFTLKFRISETLSETLKLAKESLPAESFKTIRNAVYSFVECIEKFDQIGKDEKEGNYKLLITWDGYGIVFKQKILPKKKNKYLSFMVNYSIPIVVIKRWYKSYGKVKLRELCTYSNYSRPLTIQNNSLKIDTNRLANLLSYKQIEYKLVNKNVFMVNENKKRMLTETEELYSNGLYSARDLFIIRVVEAIAPQPFEKILCIGLDELFISAVSYMAELMRDKGKIIVLEDNLENLLKLKKETSRLGINIIGLMKNNFLSFCLKDDIYYSKVVVWALSTNTGFLSHSPELRWKFSEDKLKNELANVREKQLALAAKVAKECPLFYITTSLELEENDMQIKKFLTDYNEFELVEEKLIFPNEKHCGGYFVKCIRKKL